ncbi:MAG: peptidylprolyl isomerase [Alphaproteobacteria bacterium]
MMHVSRAARAGSALFAAALTLTCLSGLALGQAKPPAGAAADPVVARVDGQPILRSEVLAAVDSLPPQFRAMPLEAIFPAVVGQLIDRKLVVAQARKEKLENDPDFKKRMAEVQERVLEQVFITKKIDAELTEAALKREYDKTPGEHKVRARHILVKTREEAVQVIRDISGGQKFEDVAAKKSLDPSGQQGGDLGFFSKDQMVEPFANAAFAMKKGETSRAPVETQFGWHVIRVDEIDLNAKQSFAEARDDLRDQLSDGVVGNLVEKLRAGAKIERFAPDGSAPALQALP